MFSESSSRCPNFAAADEFETGTREAQAKARVGTESALSRHQVTGEVTPEDGTKLGLSRDQVQILRNCLTEMAITELMAVVGRTNRTKFRDQVLKPLIGDGLIEMTIPEKPRSSKQKYRLTDTGRQVLTGMQEGAE
jgi:ATP-dependent DNA helicase RecG